MQKLWNVVNSLDTKSDVKSTLFLLILVVINLGIGAGVWLLSRIIFLTGIDWLICFMGYPGIFIGLFGGVIYLYNHEFA